MAASPERNRRAEKLIQGSATEKQMSDQSVPEGEPDIAPDLSLLEDLHLYDDPESFFGPKLGRTTSESSI